MLYLVKFFATSLIHTQLLFYSSSFKEWQIKPSSCKGTKKNWAYVASDPTHPELCTGSSWMVYVDGRHTKQEAVTVVALDQRLEEDRSLAEQRRVGCTTVEVRPNYQSHKKYLQLNLYLELSSHCVLLSCPHKLLKIPIHSHARKRSYFRYYLLYFSGLLLRTQSTLLSDSERNWTER